MCVREREMEGRGKCVSEERVRVTERDRDSTDSAQTVSKRE